MFQKIKEKYEITNESSNEGTIDEEENNDVKTFMLKVPFRGEKGEALIKKLNNTLKRSLPDTINCRVVQTGSKISKHFNLKDKTDKKHLSNFIYKHSCKNKKCNESYIGETARRKVKRTEEHAGKDKNSHIFIHSNTTKHPRAKDENFEVLAVNYPNRRKRKLAEAMFIRDTKPTLNQQKESYKLALFV